VERRRFAEYDLSVMMLGTAQFGMAYGIGNRDGQPDFRRVRAIMEAAIEGGVNCFDTAAAYGTSEELLGRALRELGCGDEVVVVTKVRALAPEVRADRRLAAQAVHASVAASRKRLGIDTLPLVLFHRETDAVHLDALEALKERGWLRHAGISWGGGPDPATAALLKAPGVAAVQLPCNVLDRRHRQAGALRDAASSGTAVFVRSLYLQGLLLMPEEKIPEALRDVIPVRRGVDRIAADADVPVHELAVRYMLSQDDVTCLLAGVETVAQVKDNIAIFEKGPLAPTIVRALDELDIELSDLVLTPAMW